MRTEGRILGIDPGTRVTGYACVECAGARAAPRLLEAGVLKGTAGATLEERLLELHGGVEELIAQLSPERVAVEKLYAHYRHPRTAILMAHARGVILLAAQGAGLPLIHIAATQVKKAVTGNGHASKEQIQRAVASHFGLARPPRPYDVADAIAIALAASWRT